MVVRHRRHLSVFKVYIFQEGIHRSFQCANIKRRDIYRISNLCARWLPVLMLEHVANPAHAIDYAGGYNSQGLKHSKR